MASSAHVVIITSHRYIATSLLFDIIVVILFMVTIALFVLRTTLTLLVFRHPRKDLTADVGSCGTASMLIAICICGVIFCCAIWLGQHA